MRGNYEILLKPEVLYRHLRTKLSLCSLKRLYGSKWIRVLHQLHVRHEYSSMFVTTPFEKFKDAKRNYNINTT